MKTEIDSRDIGQALRTIRIKGRAAGGVQKVHRLQHRGLQARITKRQPVTVPKTTRTFNIHQTTWSQSLQRPII